MSKKAAFFIPYYWTPHLEIDLELIHRHVSSGDEVTIYVCEGELTTCYSNPDHTAEICRLCKSRRRSGLNLVGVAESVKTKNFVNLKEGDLPTFQKYKGRKVSTVSELLDIRLENCFIGRKVFSDLVNTQKEHDPDLEQFSDLITKSIESCALVYLSFKNNFLENFPDIFYTFNGEFVVAHPAIAAAEHRGVSFAVHDRSAGVMNRYTVVHNDSINSLPHWKRQIDRAWANSDESEDQKALIADQWFSDRARSQKQGWFSFTTEQSEGLLPSQFAANKINLAIYNSSDWEFVGLDDYKPPFYKNQNDGLLRLAESLQHNPEFEIYLRVHPHLKEKKNSQTDFISNHLVDRFPNFHVIDADSKVSSYALMLHSNLVMTFGSTIGIEAAYNRKPSLLLGHALYEDLDACVIPNSHEEAVDWIRNRQYEMTQDELYRRHKNAAKYGYFNQTLGTPYNLFEQTDILEVKYVVDNSGAKIDNLPTPYQSGLKKELATRVELHSPTSFNPLVKVVQELEEVLEGVMAENISLKAELHQAMRDLGASKQNVEQLQTLKRHRYVNRATELKMSIGRRLRNFLSR